MYAFFVAVISLALVFSFFFFFNDTATTEIYTLSLHDALPICWTGGRTAACGSRPAPRAPSRTRSGRCPRDRKSTRLNSSHLVISYAVFCLKKKNKIHQASRWEVKRQLQARQQTAECDP